MSDVMLVTGDRHAKEADWAPLIRKTIEWDKPLVLIHGDAKGIDTIAKNVADEEQFRAQLPFLRQQTIQSLQNQRWNQFIAALEEDATIVDARDQVLQPAAAPPPITGGFGV